MISILPRSLARLEATTGCESVESKSDPNVLEFGGWKGFEAQEIALRRSKSRLYTIDASKPENGWKLSAKGQAGD